MKTLRVLFVAVTLSILSTITQAQTNSAFQAFVPEGWNLLTQAQGDLNKDGVADAALIVEEKSTGQNAAHARSLLVLLKNPGDQQYNLSVQASKAIPPGST